MPIQEEAQGAITEQTGIIPSTLGTFDDLQKVKSVVKPFGGDFKGPAFGSSSELLKGGWSFANDNNDAQNSTFAEMLKSPLKKRVRPVNYDEDDQVDENEDEETQGALLEQEEKSGAVELEPWDPESLKTGEENEVTLISTRCKLFHWIDDKESGTWKERGLGMLKLNVSNSNASSARLVMRTEGALKVILNVRILSKMPVLHRKDSKFVEFIACETPPKFTKFLVKTGSVESSVELYSAIQDITIG